MAFKTRYVHFNYQLMLFRLTNTPIIFQGYINKILVEKLNVFVIVYVDNIFIYIKNERIEHVKIVEWVLDQL